MINTTDLKRLNNLSQKLEQIYKIIRIDEYNAPLNRNEERERLFANYSNEKPYNPQFIYRIFPKEMRKPLQEGIREIHPEKNAWEYLLYKDAKQTLDTLETLVTHDPSQITAYSIAANGLPMMKLVQEAYNEISKSNVSPEVETIPAEEAAQILQEALNNAGLTDWEIIIDDVMNASMMVRSVEKKVKIRKGKNFSHHAIKRLLVHEIGTHVFRYTNGAAQKIHLLRLGLSGYMMTEEGMATYHEDKYNLRDLVTARRYALRVIAAHLSLTNSYFDVFTLIAKYTDINDAFDIVSRSKRGFSDTSEYGSHVKDKVYFEGFQKVSLHLQTNPSDYMFLMGGKISLSMLPLLKEAHVAGMFIPPHYLPELVVTTKLS